MTIKRLKQSTLLAILATAYFFILRTVGTVFPDVFSHQNMILSSAVLSLLFCLALLTFFIVFRKSIPKGSQKAVRASTNWAIFGYLAMSCVYAIEFINIIQIEILSDLLNSRLIESVKPVIPWLASFFVFVFFLNFYQESKRDKQDRLRSPKLFALVGGAFSLLLRTLILWGYISTRADKWFFDLSGSLLVFGFILAFVSFLFLEYFFLSFYYEKDIIPHPQN